MKKIQTFLKLYITMEKEFWNLVILKPKKKRFHQHEKPIAIKSVDINKILASNKARSVLVKKNLNISLDKNAKKLDLCVHFCQKWVHIEETLMKLNKYLFW